ncbi:histidine phosphatase family protein [Lacticaseibacillus porcinae]|uniref:histidine phosphatase family protein n=1 Tax=Lacticaseibacillus porcinae TaxID=1123687 RepID=UPI000F77E528|nr:histidine phosphatase family protein [Lacticaseibacillus porcinae]
MTKTIYLMRHGETLFNQEQRIQGWCDSPLTATGRAQAQAAGAWLRYHQVVIESAYCSTQERASDTVSLVCPTLSYTRLKGLKECNFGRFEGQPEYLNPPQPYGDYFVAYGGEAEAEVQQRMVATLTAIAENDPAQVLLVVSHAGACYNFLQRFGWATFNAGNERLSNCTMLKYQYENGEFALQAVIHPEDSDGFISHD